MAKYTYTSGLLLPKNYMKNGLTTSLKYWLKKVVLKEREVVREKMGFIGRTKRTIWMGSPSLHPTYSNFT